MERRMERRVEGQGGRKNVWVEIKVEGWRPAWKEWGEVLEK